MFESVSVNDRCDGDNRDRDKYAGNAGDLFARECRENYHKRMQMDTAADDRKAAPGGDYPAVYAIAWVGETYGIYRSDDQGQNWVRVNDDQHQFASLNSITGDPRTYGRLYVASASRGIVYGEPSSSFKK